MPTRYWRSHKEKSIEVFSHMTGSPSLPPGRCRHGYRHASSIGSVIISCRDFGREKEHRIDDSTKYVTALGWILEEFPVCLPPTFFRHSCNISLRQLKQRSSKFGIKNKVLLSCPCFDCSYSTFSIFTSLVQTSVQKKLRLVEFFLISIVMELAHFSKHEHADAC